MNGLDEHLPPEDEADLAALADGSLYGPRRAAIEARVAADPALAAALERQRAAVAMIAASSLPAPLTLRLKVEQLEAAQPVALAVWRRPRLVPAFGLALAATLAALVVLLAGGPPAVDDVLAVTLRPATAQASLERPFEGVRFPEYENWRATGARVDTVGGRRVRTVFYERDGRRIAYAIVAGPALGERELETLRDGDVVAVTWTRAGRTCVIAGSDVDPGALARLAVW